MEPSLLQTLLQTPLTQNPHMIQHTHWDLAQAAASNRNTPADTLNWIIQNPQYIEEYPIQKALAQNTSTPPDTLNKLVKSPDETIAATAAKNRATPADTLNKLIYGKSPKTLRKKLIKLLDARQALLLQAAATNPNTPTDTLNWLNTPIIYYLLIENPSCPPDIIDNALKNNGTWANDIKRHLLKNPKLPTNTLQQLADELNVNQRIKIAQNTSTPSPHDTEILHNLAQNPNCPTKILAQLQQHPNSRVRQAVAQNRNTPTTTLRLLTQDTILSVQIAAAINLNDNQSQQTLLKILSTPLHYTDNTLADACIHLILTAENIIKQPNPTNKNIQTIYTQTVSILQTQIAEPEYHSLLQTLTQHTLPWLTNPTNHKHLTTTQKLTLQKLVTEKGWNTPTPTQTPATKIKPTQTPATIIIKP